MAQGQKCTYCGASLSFLEGAAYTECEFCGNQLSLKLSVDENIKQRKDMANTYYLANDFDSAKNLYQMVVADKPNDAESYWMMALCTFGINYEDDPISGKKIPTCHRASYSSILQNDDFKNAMYYGDPQEQQFFQRSAERIDEILVGIRQQIANEKDYDVFICYKEKEIGSETQRTQEAEFAMRLYYKLKDEGYRTFYAPETLQGKAGRDYEPFIFHALNTAKVMLVLGFSSAHFNATWVKNEWSRFHERLSSNPKLRLVPCYNRLLMNVQEVPARLAGLNQALDVADIGVNGLADYVKDWLPKKAEMPMGGAAVHYDTAALGGAVNTDAEAAANVQAVRQMQRGYVELENGQFSQANRHFDDSLNNNPNLSKSYWGLILCELKCRNNEELADLGFPIEGINAYRNAVRFASPDEMEEYKNVVYRIGEKMRIKIAKLREIRAARAGDTKTAETLEHALERCSAAAEQGKELLAALERVEDQIQDAVSDSRGVLKPHEDAYNARRKQMVDTLEKFRSMYSEGKGLTNEEAQSYRNQLAALAEEQYKIQTTIGQLKVSSEPFMRLASLQKERDRLCSELEGVHAAHRHWIELLAKRFDALAELHRVYDPPILAVRKGDYKKAEQLIREHVTGTPSGNEPAEKKYVVKCPQCGDRISLDQQTLSSGQVTCEKCNTIVRFKS